MKNKNCQINGLNSGMTGDKSQQAKIKDILNKFKSL